MTVGCPSGRCRARSWTDAHLSRRPAEFRRKPFQRGVRDQRRTMRPAAARRRRSCTAAPRPSSAGKARARMTSTPAASSSRSAEYSPAATVPRSWVEPTSMTWKPRRAMRQQWPVLVRGQNPNGLPTHSKVREGISDQPHDGVRPLVERQRRAGRVVLVEHARATAWTM